MWITATIFILLIGVSIAMLSYYLVKLKADPQLCQTLLNEPNKNADFLTFIDARAEKNNPNNAWKKMEHRRDILAYSMAKTVNQHPIVYLSDALEVITSPNYDQSQKMYTAILMQNLPIKHYMCLMDTVYQAYEQGIIKDKEIAIEVIYPQQNTTASYWWLPDWRTRFKEYGKALFTQEQIKEILK